MRASTREEMKPYLEAIARVGYMPRCRERWIAARIVQGGERYGVEKGTGIVLDEETYERAWEYWEARWEERRRKQKLKATDLVGEKPVMTFKMRL